MFLFAHHGEDLVANGEIRPSPPKEGWKNLSYRPTHEVANLSRDA